MATSSTRRSRQLDRPGKFRPQPLRVVDAASAGRAVTLRAQGARVVIVAEGQRVGEHARRSGRNQVAYNPWHYFTVLERKPGAVRNGAPFRDWDLAPPRDPPQSGPALSKPGGDRQFVEILCAACKPRLEALAVACALALEQHTPSAAAVLNVARTGVSPTRRGSRSLPLSG